MQRDTAQLTAYCYLLNTYYLLYLTACSAIRHALLHIATCYFLLTTYYCMQCDTARLTAHWYFLLTTYYLLLTTACSAIRHALLHIATSYCVPQ